MQTTRCEQISAMRMAFSRQRLGAILGKAGIRHLDLDQVPAVPSRVSAA
jgi:hypothetical protein